MEPRYIEIGYAKRGFESAKARFKADRSVSPRNKEILLSFLRDAALGKTIRGRAKKKIGASRLLNYINHLYPLMTFLDKQLDQVSQDDMERFIEALENDEIRSRAPRIVGNDVVRCNESLSPRYKVDIKVTIRKFYKWLQGENRRYPELVEWIDTFAEARDVPALTESEVERLIDIAKSPGQRALIQMLFDGGFRIGEILNIRLEHLRLRSFDPADPSRRCFVVWVPFSKTLKRSVALPMHATTKWLTLWLEFHPAHPRILPDGTIEAEDTATPLFPMTGDYIRNSLRTLGRNTLNKRVYPHLLRHTSATYWSNKLPYFKFCKRFGWTMTSKMPQRYIDRTGVDELGIAEIYHEDERVRLLKENQRLVAEVVGLKEGKEQEM